MTLKPSLELTEKSPKKRNSHSKQINAMYQQSFQCYTNVFTDLVTFMKHLLILTNLATILALVKS